MFNRDIPGIDEARKSRLKYMFDLLTIASCLDKAGYFASDDASVNSSRFDALFDSFEGVNIVQREEVADIYRKVSKVLPITDDVHAELLRSILRTRSLSLSGLVEAQKAFGDDNWNEALVGEILREPGSLIAIARKANIDHESLLELINDESVTGEELSDLYSELAFGDKWITRELSTRLIKNFKQNPELTKLLRVLYSVVGDEYTQYIDDLFAGRLDEDKIRLLAKTDEHTALEKLSSLSHALEAVVFEPELTAGDEKTKTEAADNLWALAMSADGVEYKFTDELCGDLERRRNEDLYRTIREKITSQNEVSISAEELLYFSIITNEPELINLYDLYAIKDSEAVAKYSGIKVNFEILLGLRARRDEHFLKDGFKLLIKSMNSQLIDHKRHPLFATRLARKLEQIIEKLRNEPEYLSIVAKVDGNEKLSDAEKLYYSLVSEKRIQALVDADAGSLKAYSRCMDKLNLPESEREALKRNMNLLIILRNHKKYSHLEDPELIAKMHKRTNMVRTRNKRFQFLNLENMDLSGIDLIGNDFLSYVNLKGAILKRAQLDHATRVNFNGAIMSEAGLYNRVNRGNFPSWSHCTFDKAVLSKATVKKLQLSCCEFRGANFEGAKVSLGKPEVAPVLATFTGANFDNATMKNFNYCSENAVVHVSAVNAEMRNSQRVFRNTDAFDKLLSFTDVATLYKELDRLEKVAGKDKGLWQHEVNAIKSDIKLTIARHIKKHVMSDAVEPELRLEVMEAACSHDMFQTRNKHEAKEEPGFASSIVNLWSSQGQAPAQPQSLNPALDELLQLRDELKKPQRKASIAGQ